MEESTKIVDKIKYMVCVRCMTYNQSNYIEDAMDGFCMQETSFPYVCCILDDASIDGEQEVIHNYLRINFDLDDEQIVRNEETDDYVLMFARHKTNTNCYFAVLFLKYNHYSDPKKKAQKDQYIAEWFDNTRYTAYCEGDDYWISSNKLQMQYDYLETHPEVVLSCHRYSTLDVNTSEIVLTPNKYFDDNSYKHEEVFEFDVNYLLHTWITQTLTLMVRRDAIEIEKRQLFKYYRDVHNIYFIMKKGLGVCHSNNAAVYRKGVATSAFSSLDDSQKKHINSLVFSELAEVTKDPLVREVANILIIEDCMCKMRVIWNGYYYGIRFLNLLRKIMTRKGLYKTLSCLFYKKRRSSDGIIKIVR